MSSRLPTPEGRLKKEIGSREVGPAIAGWVGVKLLVQTNKEFGMREAVTVHFHCSTRLHATRLACAHSPRFNASVKK